MWLLVFFDLPTDTVADRRNAAQFRKDLLCDGFNMFQFSIYVRHCSSRENMDVHLKRVKQMLPPLGKVGVLGITDKQFGEMHLFYGQKPHNTPQAGVQLELF